MGPRSECDSSEMFFPTERNSLANVFRVEIVMKGLPDFQGLPSANLPPPVGKRAKSSGKVAKVQAHRWEHCPKKSSADGQQKNSRQEIGARRIYLLYHIFAYFHSVVPISQKCKL